eukprot:10791524-Ditylum_brightwellii.AAC.1
MPNDTIQHCNQWSFDTDIVESMTSEEKDRLEHDMIHPTTTSSQEECHMVQGALKHLGVIHCWEDYCHSRKDKEDDDNDGDGDEDDDDDEEEEKEQMKIQRKAKKQRLGDVMDNKPKRS